MTITQIAEWALDLQRAPCVVLSELRAAAAFALVEGIEQVAPAALLAEALPLAGTVELGHLDVHLQSEQHHRRSELIQVEFQRCISRCADS